MSMNAADMTYYLAKAGKIIKDPTMSGGLKVLIAGSVLVGGTVALAGDRVIKQFKKKK